MPKIVSIKFKDGSQELLNNVPDSLSKEAFLDLIKKTYPTKEIAVIEVHTPSVNTPAAVDKNRWVDTGSGYLRNLDTDQYKLK